MAIAKAALEKSKSEAEFADKTADLQKQIDELKKKVPL